MQTPDLTRARWHVSARTNGANTCVEATTDGAVVAVRNSNDRHPDAPVLIVPIQDWLSFLDHVTVGHLDRATLATLTTTGPFLVCLTDDGLIEVRYADEPNGPVVRYTPEEWDVFVVGVTQDGEFTLDWLLNPPTLTC